MKVSKHITLAEATKSDTAIRNGIDNTPDAVRFEAMKLVANACFEPLREWYGKPIGISSFYRCDELNTIVKGSNTSQHPKGEAIDIDADIFNNGITNKDIFLWLKANVKYDQLLWEYGDDKNPAWVHISYSKTRNRNEALVVYIENGKLKYKPYGQ